MRKGWPKRISKLTGSRLFERIFTQYERLDEVGWSFSSEEEVPVPRRAPRRKAKTAAALTLNECTPEASESSDENPHAQFRLRGCTKERQVHLDHPDLEKRMELGRKLERVHDPDTLRPVSKLFKPHAQHLGPGGGDNNKSKKARLI